MTVRAYLRQPSRPVLFQPIYIGYEKLMEGRSYLDELTGKPKEKESIWQLLGGIPKVLRTNYGQVVVNFGERIRLDDCWPNRRRTGTARPSKKTRSRAGWRTPSTRWRSRSRSTSTAPPT
jgi:glycerol-3-phosphate O-acyltransferase